MPTAVETETVWEMCRRHVKDQIDTTSHADVQKATQAILKEVDGDCEKLKAICEKALPRYISDVIRGMRHAPNSHLSSVPVPVEDIAGIDLTEFEIEGQEDIDAAAPIGPPRPVVRNNSAKVVGIRAYTGSARYQEEMRKPYAIEDGAIVSFGDMTIANLEYNVQVRLQVSRENKYAAVQLKSVIRALKRIKGTHVRQLPESVIAATMWRAA